MARSEHDWIQLGSVSPGKLTDTRLQAHWAAQVVSAIPHNYREARDDDSHTSLGWSAGMRRLEAQPVGTTPAVVAALDFDSFMLALHDTEGAGIDSFELDGHTLDDAYEWAALTLRDLLPDVFDRVTLERRDYEMPEHPVGTGTPFDPSQSALSELGNWYSNASMLLDRLAGGEKGAQPVRCWPHHFDLATLIVLDPGSGHDDMKTVGAGLSPGDSTYAEPYLYVTPWPYPEDFTSPDLPHGHWHTEGFTAAVLSGSELLHGNREAANQQRAAEEFISAAVASAKELAGG